MGPNLLKKGKKGLHLCVLNIQIDLGTKFNLDMRTLNSWCKFEGMPALKTEKVFNTMQFWIIELA